jgi:hypothetical protein
MGAASITHDNIVLDQHEIILRHVRIRKPSIGEILDTKYRAKETAAGCSRMCLSRWDGLGGGGVMDPLNSTYIHALIGRPPALQCKQPGQQQQRRRDPGGEEAKSTGRSAVIFWPALPSFTPAAAEIVSDRGQPTNEGRAGVLLKPLAHIPCQEGKMIIVMPASRARCSAQRRSLEISHRPKVVLHSLLARMASLALCIQPAPHIL